MSEMSLKLSSELCRFAIDLSQNVRCGNHVRTIYRVVNSTEIYVCSTGAYNPQEFYLSVRQTCSLPKLNDTDSRLSFFITPPPVGDGVLFSLSFFTWDDLIKFWVNSGKRVGGSKVNLFVITGHSSEDWR